MEKVHDCPSCLCEEVLCTDAHCLHADGFNPATMFCCRCMYRESLESGSYGDSGGTYSRPDCELNIQVM